MIFIQWLYCSLIHRMILSSHIPYKMKLIVWLGNPGKQYEQTRHNIWFMLLDTRVEEQWWSRDFSNKRNCEITKITYEWQSCLVCKPMTYMNLSWVSVAALAWFYTIQPEQILVIHDEIDLPIATIKYKIWWWAAGHNWLKSMIEKLWSRDFHRIRIGVDRPSHPGHSVSDYVLGKFPEQEKNNIIEKKDQIDTIIETFIKEAS